MRIKIYLFALASFLSASAIAQFDIGGTAGTCLYQGDITNNVVGRANLAIGGVLRYNITPYIAARMGLTYGRIGGDDKNAKNIDRKMRNLNFKSPIVEVSLIGEYNIFGYNSGSRRRYPGMIRSKWTPYVFGGVSYFMFNPTTTYNGETVALKDVKTEEDKAYGTMQVSIPVGIGVKYNFERFWTIGFEIGFRKTFTDYLDDVSGKSIDPAAAFALYPTNPKEAARVAALSDRSREITPGGNSSFATGYSRGNAKNLDAYTIIGVTIAKDLGNTYGRRRR